MLEARSILGAVTHVCRDSRRHGAHVLVLDDNMGTVLAAQKGRCAHFGLLRVLRRVAAHTLGCGIRCHVRWVPSELNVADHDSRRRERNENRWTRHAGRPSDSWCEEKGGSVLEARGRPGEQKVQKPALTGEPGEDSAREECISSASGWEQPGYLHRPPSDAKGACSKDGKSPETAEEVRPKNSGCLGREAPPRSPQCDRGNKEGLPSQGAGFHGVRQVLHVTDKKKGPELDAALCEYADHLFLSGETCSYRQKLQAALEYVRPETARDGSLRLPRFKRALKGWRKLSPAQVRLPMIEFLNKG